MHVVTPLKRILLAERRTQVWLAGETGIDEATLSRIVNGFHANQDKRQKIAAALGREIGEIWPFVVGGDIPPDGVAYVHVDEIVTPASEKDAA